MHTNQETGAKVAEAIRRADRTQAWIADKAGISTGTLRKKLRGGTSFTVAELRDIAEALNVSPSSLLPVEFTESQAAA